ncbi:MAG TPA: FGGY family carbohydrate kinase [Thermoguttaceae bacterium]|nr:FGGY family carbohydrate kinase [Thermoguttaceae bacterium]
MILAVDLGSTTFKAGVFDDVPALRGSGSRPLRYRYGPGGCVELEAEEVTSAFRHAIRAAIDEANVPPEAIHALAVTSQAQTFTVVDPAGRAKMPFISWQDTRAQETCRALQGEPALRDFGEHASFGDMLAVLEICQLKHLQTTQPGALAPEDRVFSLPTYLVHRCTGAVATDDNLAAMSGLYSLALEDWWPAALEVCRIRREQLPKVVPVGSVAAHTGRGSRGLGLPEGIPVVLAGNDQTAGAFGAELHEKGSLLITLGTAQVAYACTQEISAPDPALIRGPYPGGRGYRMAADSCGGNVINWARGILPRCETDSAFFARVDSAEPGCRGLVFDAELPAGEGAWRNVAFHHAPAEFARSVVEGLVRRMADMVRRLDVDRSAAKILVAGGGSRSATWVKLLADVLGTPLTVTEADPLSGAARMALASDLRGTD